MMHYTHFKHWTGKLDPEHVYNNQLIHLDKTQYMNMCFCQYMDSPNICNLRTPSIDSMT